MASDVASTSSASGSPMTTSAPSIPEALRETLKPTQWPRLLKPPSIFK